MLRPKDPGFSPWRSPSIVRLKLLPDRVRAGRVSRVGLQDGAAGAVEIGVAVLVRNLLGVAGRWVAIVVLVGQMVAKCHIAGLPGVRSRPGLLHAPVVLGLLRGHQGIVPGNLVLAIAIDPGRLIRVLIRKALLKKLHIAGLPLRGAGGMNGE